MGNTDFNEDIPKEKFDLYGTLSAPNSLTQLTAVLEAISYIHRGPYGSVQAWRGQADISWKAYSGAVRRVINSNQLLETLTLEEKVAVYEENLLNEARLKGYGFHDNRSLSDLELLASLQHFGAATRLLDFTRNAYVALWFASSEMPDKWGLLLGVSRPGNLKEKDVQLPNLELIKENSDRILIWEPLRLYERMRVQQSVFVFSHSHDGAWGSLSPHPFEEHIPYKNPFVYSDRGLFSACAISPELKAKIREYWQPMFGYSGASLFPDIEG